MSTSVVPAIAKYNRKSFIKRVFIKLVRRHATHELRNSGHLPVRLRTKKDINNAWSWAKSKKFLIVKEDSWRNSRSQKVFLFQIWKCSATGEFWRHYYPETDFLNLESEFTGCCNYCTLELVLDLKSRIYIFSNRSTVSNSSHDQAAVICKEQETLHIRDLGPQKKFYCQCVKVWKT